MTRILKEYGDVLERYQLAPDKADIGRELRVLRCLLLLINLTGRLQPLSSQDMSAKHLCRDSMLQSMKVLCIVV